MMIYIQQDHPAVLDLFFLINVLIENSIRAKWIPVILLTEFSSSMKTDFEHLNQNFSRRILMRTYDLWIRNDKSTMENTDESVRIISRKLSNPKSSTFVIYRLATLGCHPVLLLRLAFVHVIIAKINETRFQSFT